MVISVSPYLLISYRSLETLDITNCNDEEHFVDGIPRFKEVAQRVRPAPIALPGFLALIPVQTALTP
jgi:hypothetical protein